MKKVVLLLLLGICHFMVGTSYGQFDFKKSSKRLLQFNEPYNISILNTNIKTGTDSISLNNIGPSNFLLFSKNDIYISIKGTGKVFRADTMQIVKRIDKTEFGGATFGSADFIYKDTLFSIGGYGFWNITGAIRYFNSSTKEWDIFRSNVNLPFANGINAFSYFDSKNEKFHLIYNKYTPEYVHRPSEEINECYYQCLDLKTKKWMDEPLLINPAVAKSLSDLVFLQTTPQGIILNSKYFNSTLLFDFASGNAYSIIDSKYTEFLQIKNKVKNGLIFSSDSSLKLYDCEKDTIYTYSFLHSDLTPLNIAIHVNKESNKFNWKDVLIMCIGLTAFIFCILFIIYFKKYIQTKKLERTDRIYTIESDKKTINDYINNLSEIEKQLLELLVRNNWNNINTSVNQINKILGTEKKDVKIQNNIRGEVINQINNKFTVYSSIQDNLIERQRVEFDKRYVEYFINDKLLQKFPKKIFD